MKGRPGTPWLCCWPALCLACSGPLDAGHNHPHGLLPVDERNPVVLCNDGFSDNWQGEYALLWSKAHGTPVAGLIVNTSGPWPDLQKNLQGWKSLIAAARASGIEQVPDPTTSESQPLEKPADGQIESTKPNASQGARFLVDAAARFGRPSRPLAIVTGGRLTDVADAYLLDPSIAARVVVVASLGVLTSDGAEMSPPNGEMDPWADRIVAGRLPYVQVNAFYDQLTDVPQARLPELPANELGAWIASKQPNIFDLDVAADQVAVLAAMDPRFARAVQRARLLDGSAGNPGGFPSLVFEASGPSWVVSEGDSAGAIEEFWRQLALLPD